MVTKQEFYEIGVLGLVLYCLNCAAWELGGVAQENRLLWICSALTYLVVAAALALARRIRLQGGREVANISASTLAGVVALLFGAWVFIEAVESLTQIFVHKSNAVLIGRTAIVGARLALVAFTIYYGKACLRRTDNEKA